MKWIDITVDGVNLSVRFEVERYQREPFSWGASRGEDTEIEIDAIYVGDVDITKCDEKESREKV